MNLTNNSLQKLPIAEIDDLAARYECKVIHFSCNSSKYTAFGLTGVQNSAYLVDRLPALQDVLSSRLLSTKFSDEDFPRISNQDKLFSGLRLPGETTVDFIELGGKAFFLFNFLIEGVQVYVSYRDHERMKYELEPQVHNLNGLINHYNFFNHYQVTISSIK